MSNIIYLPRTLPPGSLILCSPIEPRRWGPESYTGFPTSPTIPGFISDRPFTGPDGNYLRATFCFCKTHLPVLVPRDEFIINNGGGDGLRPVEMVPGHFWRYGYVNQHDNATYFLNHCCMQDAFPRNGCGYDAPGRFEPKPVTTYHHTQFTNDWAFACSPLPGGWVRTRGW